MKTRSVAAGVVLITAAVLLPVVGWRLSVKSYNDDHTETKTEKLVEAAGAGEVDGLNAMIRSGVQVKAGTEGGIAPLFAAVSSSQTPVINLLLSHGADVNQKYTETEAEKQRLARAKYKGLWKVSSGDTPLIAAARAGNVEVAKLLLSKGADIKAKDDDENSALSLAMQAKSLELVRLLIQKGAPVTVTDSNGDTPLMWVCQRNDRALAIATIKAGVDIDNINIYRDTALIQTVRANTLPDIAARIARVAKDLNSPDTKGFSPLSYAVSYNRPELVKVLLNRGASTGQVDGDGSTPLITAAFFDEKQMVQLLLAAHADPRIKDKTGMTALDWAKSKQNKEIISMLEKAQGTVK